MASLIDPVCGMDLFQMKSFETARHCGRLNGLLLGAPIGFVVGILVGGVGSAFFGVVGALVGFGLTVCTISILFGFVNGWMKSQKWKTYNLRIENYMSAHGGSMNRAEAVDKVRQDFNMDRLADSNYSRDYTSKAKLGLKVMDLAFGGGKK